MGTRVLKHFNDHFSRIELKSIYVEDGGQDVIIVKWEDIQRYELPASICSKVNEQESDGTNNNVKESCQNRAIFQTRKVGVKQVDNLAPDSFDSHLSVFYFPMDAAPKILGN